MSAITNFSLGTQRLTMVIIFTIIVGGLGQFFTFPRLEDPAIVIREVVVTAFFPGMKPADIGAGHAQARGADAHVAGN